MNASILLSVYASFGAPILYVGYAAIENMILGRNLDFPLLITMLGASLVFSLIVTVGLAVAFFGIAILFNIKEINIPLLSIGYVIALSVFVLFWYGYKQGFIFAVFASANAVLCIFFSTRNS